MDRRVPRLSECRREGREILERRSRRRRRCVPHGGSENTDTETVRGLVLSPAVVALLSVLILAVAGALTAVWMRTRREVTTPTELAVHAALHTASLAARPLRRGLD